MDARLGFRCCLSSVMDDCAAWDGVAHGPRAFRSNYSADFDAAGHAFVSGEPEQRVMDIDCISRRRRSTSTVVPDGHDVAGAHSPRLEVRSLSIDDRAVRRRVHSEPPADVMPRATRAEKQIAMQAFGVAPSIDADIHRRRRRCANPETPRTPTRDQAAKMAAHFGDIEGLIKRKHFHGSASPGSLLSPRLTARSLESIDIDSHFGRSIPKSSTASIGMLPVSENSPSYDVAASGDASTFPGSPRGWSSNVFFEQTLAAKHYAKLLGRATNSNQKRLAELSDKEAVRELKKLEKQMWADLSRTSSQRSLSKVVSALVSPAESFQSFSTAASSAEAALRSAQLGEASISPFANAMKQEMFNSMEMRHENEKKQGSDGPESEAVTKLPIHLRRVLASMDTGKLSLSKDFQSMCGQLLQPTTEYQSTTTQSMLKQPAELEKFNSSCKQRFSLRSNTIPGKA